MATQKRMGLGSLTTLVAGNMIGSAIFVLPANLASLGSISLLSWIFTTLGAFFLAIIFSKLSFLIPKTGGPYAYAQAGFGDFIGFQTAYNYWLSVWIGNAALVVAMVGYLAVFFPALHHIMPSVLTGMAAIWLLTVVNLISVQSVNIMQIVTTVLKFLPIGLVLIFGWWYFHPSYLVQNFNISGQSNFSAVSNAAALTLWAFIGLESATIPAGFVDNPQRNVPLATLLGTAIAAVVNILTSMLLMGIIPMHQLALDVSPFATAANMMFGDWGRWVVAAGAAISCFGCLNGWILIQGQVGMAAADDQLFPKVFATRNRAGMPVWGLVITGALISLFLVLTAQPYLANQYKIIILIATFTSLIPYLYTAVAAIIIERQRQALNGKMKFIVIVALLATLYTIWALIGTGKNTLFYGSIFMFSSVPLYAWICAYRKRSIPAE